MKPQILSEMLRTVKRDNPGASRREIEIICRDKVRVDRELQDALFDYWFANSADDYEVVQTRPHETAVIRNSPAPRARRTPEETAKAAARRTELVTEMKTKIVSRLMEFTLSDGTQLRHATFGQCREEGSWLASIGKLGKTNEIVGKKLTEADLLSLKQRHSKRFDEWVAS